MKITNPTKFVDLGAIIRYLCGASAGYRLGGDDYIIGNLERLKQKLSELGYSVSLNLFNKTLTKLVGKYKKLIDEEKPSVAILNDEMALDLYNKMLALENTVLSESDIMLIASPVQRRFGIEDLLQRPESLLATGVYSELTDIAKSDFSESCRCIAFECPTASAFSLLRCVEECVRQLYKAYFPRKSTTEHTWGALLHELGNKSRRPKPDQTLLEHLDHLRKRFRNPTDHPDKTYHIEETEELMHLCLDAISRCVRDEQVKSRSGT